jgi:hypothetical protein
MQRSQAIAHGRSAGVMLETLTANNALYDPALHCNFKLCNMS